MKNRERTVRRAGRPTGEGRTRDPEGTRRKLLDAAFREIHLKGFQAASLESILAAAGVTKGALYHHFGSKADLGLAVVDEIIREMMFADWIDPVEAAPSDPITALQGAVRAKAASFTDEGVVLGCPLNNLAQEMSPIDGRFRERVVATFEAWEEAFATALERGQAAGTVRRDVDPRAVARFVVASAEGTFGRAKAAHSKELLDSNLETLVSYLETLREEP